MVFSMVDSDLVKGAPYHASSSSPQQLREPLRHHQGPPAADAQEHRVRLRGDEVPGQTGLALRRNQLQPHQQKRL